MRRARRWKIWCANVAKLPSPLLEYLGNSADLGRFSEEEWSLMFSEARQTGLLGRLSQSFDPISATEMHFPDRLHKHLLAASIQSATFQLDVRRELAHIKRALSGLNAPVLLLKGASYVLLNLPAASGRIFSDIDLLVPKQHLASAEALLMLGGWLTGKLDDYDQRYYREWSHEIPPMTHMRRGTAIDLHHSLVMPTCRLRVDSEKMIKDAFPADENGFWWRLKDEDVVLHAASHLMLNSEFERGLRDLWDIDLLFRYFSSKAESFPNRLLNRAVEVGLGEILQQALYLAQRFFGTPLPDRLNPGRKNLFISLVACSSLPRHPDTRPPWQAISDILLMYREMYLRLPNHLLVTHLVHKTTCVFRRSEEKTAVG